MGLDEFFPPEIWSILKSYCEGKDQIDEIRFRVDQPVFCKTERGEVMVREKGKPYCLSKDDMKKMLYVICKFSVYAYEEQRKKGYLTLKGGHRLGLSGQFVMDGNCFMGIRNVSGINLRVANEKQGIARGILRWCYQAGAVKNVMIISPPGCGKTTLLRELIRNISDGSQYGEGKNVSVIDERSEIGGAYEGIVQNHLGMRTDCFDGVTKKQGIGMAIRTMTPDVIAVDEVGGEEEDEYLLDATYCGISLLLTIHGNDLTDIVQRRSVEKLMGAKRIHCYIEIHKRNGKRSYVVKNENGELLEEVQ